MGEQHDSRRQRPARLLHSVCPRRDERVLDSGLCDSGLRARRARAMAHRKTSHWGVLGGER